MGATLEGSQIDRQERGCTWVFFPSVMDSRAVGSKQGFMAAVVDPPQLPKLSSDSSAFRKPQPVSYWSFALQDVAAPSFLASAGGLAALDLLSHWGSCDPWQQHTCAAIVSACIEI